MLQISEDKLCEVKEKMCDEYCKWPFNTETQADLNEICAKCPLNDLEYPLGVNGWQE